MIVYDRTFLKSLRSRVNSSCVNKYRDVCIPYKTKKRGKKGGVKTRMRRRKCKPVLPVVVSGNVRSINNKIDELTGHIAYSNEYRNASVICLCETFLHTSVTDSCVDIENFTLVRCDRDSENTQKSLGGGVCIYINERWCHPNNIKVMEKISAPSLELLSISLRPYYLPREFSKVNLNVVYIPPDANSKSAIEQLSQSINQQMTSSPESVVLIAGDFNHVKLDSTFSLYQHVSCPTRKDKTLDLFYSNVKGGFKTQQLAPLGNSDHNMLLHIPKYKTKLKSIGVKEKTVQVWDENTTAALQGCFACTDWDIFRESSNNLEELNDVITSYIHFCEDMIVEKKTVKTFGNNKPWVTVELKTLLNKKKRAFQEGNEEDKRSVQKQLKGKLDEGKQKYKEKVEGKFRSNEMKEVWKGVKSLAGANPKRSEVNIETSDEKKYVDELNRFYARFDKHDFKEEIKAHKECLQNSDSAHVTVTEEKVAKSFKSLKPGKACGPDGISPGLLKACATELAYIYSVIYNDSLETGCIPEQWKTSKIIPVPKTPKAKDMNDFRPIALTPIPMKCLERIVLEQFLPQCGPHLDNNQFAYKAKRGVDDAILLFVQNIYKHLDLNHAYVRTLFVDFSSAFNTIQPHLLVPKLLEMEINPNIVLWLLNFLTNRPQFVYLNKDNSATKSDTIFTNTGAPQGTVLAPILFSIYTNDCTSSDKNIHILKYADDTAIQAMILTPTDLLNYYETIRKFADWCKENFLELNVKKTKEMVIDFRKENCCHETIEIDNEAVERVKEYKYLGVTIDEKMDWSGHSNNVISKMKVRLHFMRKLYSIGLDHAILTIFFHSCVTSVLSYCIAAWGGNIKKSEKIKIERVLKQCNKMLEDSCCRKSFDPIYATICNQKLNKIMNDETHPLHNQIQFSCRSNRLLHLPTKRQRHFDSFLPFAVRNFSPILT